MNIEKKQLEEKGYFIIRNFLDKNEIQKFEKIFQEKKLSQNNSENFETENEVCWEYLANPKLLSKIKNTLGEKIFYMHDVHFNEAKIEDNERSWHRDNPCRSTGKGPDWDKNFPYNVVTTITYMSSSEETNSQLNVLKKSHKTNFKFSLTNVLRLIHRKLINKRNTRLIKLLIEKLIGEKISYEVGDCVVFLANLYHMGNGVPKNQQYRKLIISRYGGSGKHSANFMNYIFKHRNEMSNRYKGSNKKNDFFNFLKKNNIFKAIPEEKIEIEGVYSKTK